jgi:hypothetical protein
MLLIGVAVYTDSFQNGFSSWSWDGGVSNAFDFSYTASVHSGSDSIAFIPGNYNGLYLHCDNCIDLNTYSTLQVRK